MSRHNKPRLNRSSVLRYDESQEDDPSSLEPRETGNAEMHIPGLGSAANVPPTPRDRSPQPMDSQSPPESKPSEDRVEISANAQSVEPGEESDVRALRLAQIKAAIEAGEYETQDKLDAALSRLFEELGLHDDEESPD